MHENHPDIISDCACRVIALMHKHTENVYLISISQLNEKLPDEHYGAVAETVNAARSLWDVTYNPRLRAFVVVLLRHGSHLYWFPEGANA